MYKFNLCIFSKNLKEIGSRAFKKCLNVTDVEYPIEKLEVLGERACEDLKNVETVTFPARVNKIDWNSFWNIFYFNSSLYTLYIYNPYMNLDEFQRKTITLIYGYRNSTAYECARKNEINFIAIDRDEPSSETSQQTTEPNTTPKEDPETPIETTTSEVSETPKESTTPENVETPKETTTLENVETSKDTTTPDNLETPSENSANDTTVPIEETTPKELDTAIEIITAEPGVTKYSTTADSNQTTMQGINDKSTKPAIKKIKEKNWHTVKITWKKISGIKKYILYRSKKKSGKYKKIATTSKRSVLDKKVKAGAKYYYKIKVTNSRKESFISKTKAIRVKGTPNKPKIKLSVNSSFWQIHWGIISDNSVGIEIYMKNGEGKFKKFTRINRTVNIKKSKKKKGVTGIQSSVDSLKKGLAYQFKARTYTKVKGKKVYSKWSKTIHYTRK